ncbi:MAG TPA: Rne/Rng family ribonuclease, partial [Nocardioidaceae bacterium]|nr:Rne/Rng family ribonuclease [Nocardioidaceae bacterium]
MLEDENSADNQAAETPAESNTPAKKVAKKAPAKKVAAKKTAAKKTATTPVAAAASQDDLFSGAGQDPESAAPAEKVAARKTAVKKDPVKKVAVKRTAKKAEASPAHAPEATEAVASEAASGKSAPPATMLLFKAPEPSTPVRKAKAAAAKPVAETAPDESKADKQADNQGDKPAGKSNKPKKKTSSKGPSGDEKSQDKGDKGDKTDQADDQGFDDSDDDSDDEQGGNRRRRRRGGRRRRKSGGGGDSDADSNDDENFEADAKTSDDSGKGDSDTSEGPGGTRRRRRRSRAGEESDTSPDDPAKTVVRVRKPRSPEDEITSVTGSTRLEAKKQRRREGREAGRRRAPIVSEAEFLARREAVDRIMVIRQKKDLTQIAVLEDKVLVEHYVARESQTSLIGNVYLGRVQNVLPSMEAAFIDIGKGRNAVLYAGEVNWDALGAKNSGQRKIEQVLKSGQPVLVQVSKDPIGHKGARLTSQISLPGRFLVYVPDGTTSGISRKLPDTERTRLKTLLKEIVPDTAGVIVRTAAEGASEEELTRDVERLTARWDDIAGKVDGGTAPQLLYGEPDLTLKVVRDLFTEDFAELVVSGSYAWDMVDDYVNHLAPDLAERLEKYDGGEDVFAVYRIDEQIAKGLDRKVWLPSGGSLVIDRTEAMTVVDVNTGKFTGSGGNLEETVTKNNLEAAEEVVRQLRLRDIGGIIVVDFIDMVLESNRDLVLRRMVECLGRDRTRHQVAEVTSLGLVQMTRKRIGTGLLEAFSENCEHCQGRGLIVQHEPVEPKKKSDDEPRRNRRSGRGRGRGDEDGAATDKSSTDKSSANGPAAMPTPKDVAAVAKPEQHKSDDQAPETDTSEPAMPDSAKPESDSGGGSSRGGRRRATRTSQP